MPSISVAGGLSPRDVGGVPASSIEAHAVVHHAVGIFLFHAGSRDPAALQRFLRAHEPVLHRSALRRARQAAPV